MEELVLNANIREEIGKNKVNALRRQGFVPAVIYSKEHGPLALKVSHRELIQLVHQHRIEGVLIKLQISDGKKNAATPCVVKEIQYEPVHENITHVDFNRISLTEAIEVKVPVKTEGEPVGVKQEGGSLDHLMWEIEIECLPTAIPEEVKVDVAGLKMGEAIHVKDLPLPEGVKLRSDPEAVVVSVIAPMKEEPAEEAVEAAEGQEPEAIKEKKESPEGEGAASEGSEEK